MTKQDPYLVMTIGKLREQTLAIQNGGVNPVWEQALNFQLNDVDSKESLVVDAWDKDRNGKDDRIGSAKIPLRTLFEECFNNSSGYWWNLTSGLFKKNAGAVLLSMQWDGTDPTSAGFTIPQRPMTGAAVGAPMAGAALAPGMQQGGGGLPPAGIMPTGAMQQPVVQQQPQIVQQQPQFAQAQDIPTQEGAAAILQGGPKQGICDSAVLRQAAADLVPAEHEGLKAAAAGLQQAQVVAPAQISGVSQELSAAVEDVTKSLERVHLLGLQKAQQDQAFIQQGLQQQEAAIQQAAEGLAQAHQAALQKAQLHQAAILKELEMKEAGIKQTADALQQARLASFEKAKLEQDAVQQQLQNQQNVIQQATADLQRHAAGLQQPQLDQEALARSLQSKDSALDQAALGLQQAAHGVFQHNGHEAGPMCYPEGFQDGMNEGFIEGQQQGQQQAAAAAPARTSSRDFSDRDRSL